MVIADVLKRWRALAGDTDAQLLTGTDEHGMKVRATMGYDVIHGADGMDRSSRLRRLPEWTPRLFAI